MGIEDWSGLHELDRAAWALAAVTVAARDALPAAEAVAAALGIDTPDDASERERLAAIASAPLLQASRYLDDREGWSRQDDAALLAQGRASAAAGTAFATVVLPQLLGSDVAGAPVRILDVGVGVAAMAVAICEHVPQATIVGLDVLQRPLELARSTITGAGMEDRIELRLLDVGDLDEDDEYDLAWLPAPFIPRPALERGLAAVLRAVRPGRWVMVGHGRYGGDPLDDAVTRFKTVAYGGTPLDDAEAAALLTGTGFVDVRHLPTPPGAPALTVGRRPHEAARA